MKTAESTGVVKEAMVYNDTCMTFSSALMQLKAGKKVRRVGWNGKNMWLDMITPDVGTVFGWYLPTDRDGQPIAKCPRGAYIGMKTADDKFVPWLCSQTDMLAEDWELVG